MSLVRIRIAAFLLVVGLCNAETTGSREIKVNDSVGHSVGAADILKTDVDSSEGAQDDDEENDLPILPPIILLDFDNDTQSDNATTDEKSKRTVNNGLGYGFDRNSVQAPRKYNYYFPGGKTGTTVSIEESISPFLPRTIIEKVPASDQRSVPAGSFSRLRQQENRPAGSTRQNPANYRYHDPPTKSQPVFGLRTKLTKISNSEQYGGFIPIARPTAETYVEYQSDTYASTTQQPVVFGSTEEATYVTPRPHSYAVSGSSRYTYVMPNPQSYVEVQSQRYLGQGSQHTINVHGYSRPAQASVESSTPPSSLDPTFLESVQSRLNSQDYARPGMNAVESSTAAPGEVEGAASYSPGLPRYTVENGVRYENKIFWKYPDGRVSDVPPMTYETYSEYPSLAALQAASQDAKSSQDTSQIYESGPTENSVLSQGPVQFPMAPESGNRPSPFISADSLSSLPQQQVYRLGYQNLVGQKQIVPQQQSKAGSGVAPTYTASSTTPAPPRSSFKSSGKSQRSRGESIRRPILKYMVNSPNPEYTESYTTENAARSTPPSVSFVSSARGNSARKTNAGGRNLDNYSNLQYTDLLNYNPSISQYIKNPASILNVQPTFVQAGSSLIPVIILRVDGVPPIQPKATPNVNLKALLQQYLVQYAKSIEELARPSTYELGNDQPSKDQASFATSSLRELARLAQTDGQDLLGNPTESYIGKSSYQTSNLNERSPPMGGRYGERTAARPKVKSVQIVEDPRFPNYRVKN